VRRHGLARAEAWHPMTALPGSNEAALPGNREAALPG